MIDRTVEPDSPRLRHTLAPLLVGVLLLTSLESGCATQPPEPDYQTVVASTPPPAPPAQASPGVVPAVTQSPQQLDQLVAPIALYPDELVAQVLAAATYPAEVVEAERWMQANPNLKGDALGKAVNTQPWDDSVKALAQFPSVLAMMDKNLSWTSSLGEAYMNNSQAVMDAVQQMRVRAQQAGNLKSTPQENVTDQGQTVVIEPANPEVVYVPEYDPWLVYGEPLAFYPGWVGFPGLFIGGPGIDFGFGIGIGIFGGFGWGWHHWGADWHGHGIDHDHAPYHSHSPAFGHHGPGGFGHAGGFAHGGGVAGSHSGGFGRPGGFHPGGMSGGAANGSHSSAFSGFNHGGAARGFAARGSASAGGFHGGGAGGFHGGGGGGFHGGGGGGGHR
jgi:Protein of unknown function (DUF3300)